MRFSFQRNKNSISKNKNIMNENNPKQEPEMDTPLEQEQETAATTNENMDEATESTDTESQVSPLEALELELQEANNRYLRLVAEFDNYRKRVARENQERIKNASEEIIVSLLDVVDDTERAAQQIETSEDLEAIKTGINLVFTKLRKILEQKGLQEMESLMKPFDTDLHEAITEIPAGDEAKVGLVLDQVIKGYKLNDKVIRHAKVVVGK